MAQSSWTKGMFIYYRRGDRSKSGGSTKNIEGRKGGVRKNLDLMRGVYENNINGVRGGSTKIKLMEPEMHV